MNTQTTTEPTPTEHTFVYIGRRLNEKSKVIHAWLLGEREVYYDKVAGQVVGGIYAMNAVVDDTNLSVYRSTMRYTGQKVDDVDQVAAWQLADQHARTTAAEAAAERRHAKSTELDAALAPLVAVVRKVRTVAEARALAKVVADKILEAWWNR